MFIAFEINSSRAAKGVRKLKNKPTYLCTLANSSSSKVYFCMRARIHLLGFIYVTAVSQLTPQFYFPFNYSCNIM